MRSVGASEGMEAVNACNASNSADESGKESDAAVEDHYSGGEKKENESVRISKGVKNSKRRKVVDCGAK